MGEDIQSAEDRCNHLNKVKGKLEQSLDECEDLGTRLAEVGSNTSTQTELNKKRERELVKLKADLDEANIAHEGTLAALRQKQNNSMGELGNQIDGIDKNKTKMLCRRPRCSAEQEQVWWWRC